MKRVSEQAGGKEVEGLSQTETFPPRVVETSDSRRGIRDLFGGLEVVSAKRLLWFTGCLLAALIATISASFFANGLTPAGLRGLFILVLAASLWVTETLPAFAVGILVIGLKIALLGKPGGVFAQDSHDWEAFVQVLGHPLIWLFFGGFILASGAAKTGLDRQIAGAVLPRFGTSRAKLLAGCMGLTFVFSMFMSNTATTAMMLALLAPVVSKLPRTDRFRPALILGTAVAANLGGMGSLIGTPPNAIAAAALEGAPGGGINFLQWMIVGLPPALCMLVFGWWFIQKRYHSSDSENGAPLAGFGGADTEAPSVSTPRWQRLATASTLIATIFLWLSGQWHGLPTAVVSFVPIVALTATGVLNRDDMRALPWDVLFLLAGGLALGQTVQETGVANWMVGALPFQGLGQVAVALLMAYLCAGLSNLMSNTAAANVLVPIGVSLASGFEAHVAVPIALGASAAMCLPISTPPNALAFASGHLKNKDFLWLGLLVALAAPALGVAWMALVAPWLFG